MKPPAASERTEWDLVLDQLEQALATGEEFSPPDGLPVLPRRLLPRAEALLARQDEVIAELSAERERVGTDLAAQRRMPRAAGVAAATGASRSL